jgi:ribosomal protein L24
MEQGGIIDIDMPIDAQNVAVIDHKTASPPASATGRTTAPRSASQAHGR